MEKRQEGEGRKEGSAAGGEFFSDKVPMDLRRRRRIKSKERKNNKRKGEKRFVTNLATKG